MLPVCGVAQWNGRGERGMPLVLVVAEPQFRGDVRFTIEHYGFRQPPDLEGALRQSLGCNWRPMLLTTWDTEGTCRHLLPPQNRRATVSLDLSPLAAALHKAGAKEVVFRLFSEGVPFGSGWVRGEAGLRVNTGRITEVTNWTFRSEVDDELPPAFLVEVGEGWRPDTLAMPVVFLLVIPAALVLWFRVRIRQTGDAPTSGIVWVNWVLLGIWLYWISVIRMEHLVGFATLLDADLWLVTLVLGVLLFCGLPLAACGLCVWIITPELNAGDPEPGRVWQAVRLNLVSQAASIVPLGIFLMGIALAFQEFRAGLFSLLAAYAVSRALRWCTWRSSAHHPVELEPGKLRERAMELAKDAGVELKSVGLLSTRSPLDANAYASRQGIALTKSLVENLTRREVDAILGHEIGHLRSKHIGQQVWLGTLYTVLFILVVGPALRSLVRTAGLPDWFMNLPMLPLGYTIVTTWTSRRHELAADERAAKLTDDPEGAIASLARLAQITKSPLSWSGIQGSILSHPSMRERVLTLARRFQVSDSRALAILHNPELIEEGGRAQAARYELPSAPEEPVFTAVARASHHYWSNNWPFGAVLIGTLIAAECVAGWCGLDDDNRVLAVIASLPVAGLLGRKAYLWWNGRFVRRMGRRMEARGIIPRDGVLAALIPGDRIRSFEGVRAWDLGKLHWVGDLMTYTGEQARFALQRAEVETVQVIRGPLQWSRDYAVQLRSSGAVFNVWLPERGSSLRSADELMTRVEAWYNGEPGRDRAPELQDKIPQFPEMHTFTPSRSNGLWYVGKTAAMFFAGGFLMTAVVLGYSHVTTAVPFAAMLVYLATIAPVLIRRTD